MATSSFIFLGFGAALFYLKLNPEPIRNRVAFFLAWCALFATIFMTAVLMIIAAYNNGERSNQALSILWGEIITWILLGAGGIALYQALTPLTGKPEKTDRADKSADSERSRRRGGRAESQRRDAIRDDDEGEGTRARSRTPGMGLRSPSRFGMAVDAEQPDPALEAKVDDALDAEPELVESMEEELPLEELDSPAAAVGAAELPPLESEPVPIKVKTMAASISRSRNQAVERPKTERPKSERSRPRSGGNPAVRKSSAAVPVGGAKSGSGSRTGIPVTGAGEPLSVPVASPASRSGKRPAASGIRPSAKSGIEPGLTESGEVDTPSKDQYLDR